MHLLFVDEAVMLHTGDMVKMKGYDYRGTVLGEIRYNANWYKIVSWDWNPDEPKESPLWCLEKIND